MCRDKDNYHSISVRNRVFSKLGELTKKVIPGTEISRAKVVEKLVNDSHSSLNTIEVTNENRHQRQKI
jgi:hypothetical protein|tara:strand:- start:205 stop:408 length:204 start_codon:yes stop_codon:yes gene_type:complete